MDRNRLWRLASAALVGFAVFARADAQGDPDLLKKVLDEGKNRNQVMLHLRHLSEKIGPRLIGSKNYSTATEWTARKFREWGLKNVRTEQFLDIPVGFDRGARQVARMVSPTKRDFEFTTPAWGAGTKGLVRGPAVIEPTTMEEFEKVKDRLKGAWLLGQRAMGLRSQGADTATSDLQDAIIKSGIAGRVFGSSGELVQTSGRYTGLTMETLPTVPRITIRASDMKAIRDALEAGKPVELEFDIQNEFTKGPIAVHNVIADIPGTERPDEYVIVGGHLDSWDGPGSQGCCDNGTGSSITMEAARMLAKYGAKPKRTIRFILWGGEEEGLLGSRAYVAKHVDEMSKISAVFVDDMGTGYQGGITCLESQAAMLRQALAPMEGVFPDMPFQLTVRQPTTGRRMGGGGSDHAAYTAVGIPGFFWRKAGKFDYNYIWHTQNDRYDQAVPEYLVQAATNTAIVSYNIACASELMPRK